MKDLFCFRDTCNVYVVRDGDEAIAIDFGSGKWLRELPRLDIRSLRHVFLTHHHADQCMGLLAKKSWPFQIHAPANEERFLSSDREPIQSAGCPASYSLPAHGIRGIRYDMVGFSDLFWNRRRIRFIHTPGHGPNALSILLTHHEQQILFCGDAAHAGATLWQPYHLEWDHWTGTGALAAWEGVRRLANLHIDLLCPSHGPMIRERPRQMLRQLTGKLLDFYHAKGHICPGERDYYVEPEHLRCGARRVLPNLVQYANNSYLLRSANHEAFLIDPPADTALTEALLDELDRPKVTAATATHYHGDHSEGLASGRAKVWLHPWVARALRSGASMKLPFLPAKQIRANRLWPERGRWRWNEYEFQIAPFPGQTWWHCAFMTNVDGEKVLFGGDNFQPASRWNGTGGFCALNGSRFEAFVRSARLVLAWKPDIMATGHRTFYRFHASQFRKIIEWARRADAATKALCPSGDLETDYYLHHHKLTK